MLQFINNIEVFLETTISIFFILCMKIKTCIQLTKFYISNDIKYPGLTWQHITTNNLHCKQTKLTFEQG